MIFEIVIEGRLRRLTLAHNREDGSFTCEIDGQVLAGSARLLQPGILSLVLAGNSYRCILERLEHPEERKQDAGAVHLDGKRYGFHLEDPRSLKARRARADGEHGPFSIKAPMPGRIVRVLVEAGAEVQAQQAVLVIEAMKMQNELKAPKAGRIAELRAAPGAAVNAGEVLAILE